MRKPSVETQLRTLKREMKQLRERNAKLERKCNWGAQMSNLCFNLSQDTTIREDYRKSMKICQKGWDEA